MTGMMFQFVGIALTEKQSVTMGEHATFFHRQLLKFINLTKRDRTLRLIAGILIDSKVVYYG